MTYRTVTFVNLAGLWYVAGLENGCINAQFGGPDPSAEEINVLILKLQDLTVSQFDSICLSSVLPSL